VKAQRSEENRPGIRDLQTEDPDLQHAINRSIATYLGFGLA